MIVSIAIYKLERKEENARVAHLFGNYEKAAGLYAAAARKYWDAGAYSGVLRTVMNACDSLHMAGMDEEVIEGIVTVSKMFVNARRPIEAISLGEFYARWELKDPLTFKGGSQFSTQIKEICKQKLLLVVV
jgi:hypothetical protein